MIDKTNAVKSLQKIFSRYQVVDMNKLFQTLKTKSRMSIFRRLREIGYLSSYTHTGRYYTLSRIPQFDNYGLWFYQGIGFSRFGTLKDTIVELVEDSPTGLTHLELNHILRVKVHNTLLKLVQQGRVDREHFKKVFLYIAADADKANVQLSRRRDTYKEIEISAAIIIEVLIETIHAGHVRIAPALVANRLMVRGVSITIKQVEQIFFQYGIAPEKKTTESGLARWKP